MGIDLKPEVAALVAFIDEGDKLVDMAAPFIPGLELVKPWADSLRALADKLELVATNRAAPAAAEVAAVETAADAAEAAKFPGGS